MILLLLETFEKENWQKKGFPKKVKNRNHARNVFKIHSPMKETYMFGADIVEISRKKINKHEKRQT